VKSPNKDKLKSCDKKKKVPTSISLRK